MMKKIWTLLVCLVVAVCVVCVGCGKAKSTETAKPTTPAATDVSKHNGLKITMLDIGTGDCILIQDGKQNVLVDTGHSRNKDLVLKRLKDAGIKRIHTVILTHHDADHIGNILPILGKFKVGRVYDNGSINERNSVSKKLHDILAKGNYNHKDLVAGDRINFGKDWYMEVLSPGDFLQNKNGKPLAANDTNNRSVVTKLYCGDFTMLFTGDIEAPAEDCILKREGEKLKSDVLKVAHHGSKTSSIYRFINLVKPKYAIMSTGEYSEYHHPNKEVLKRLEHLGAKVYWTRRNGDIVITTDGKKYDVQVQYPQGNPKTKQDYSGLQAR